MPVPQPLDTADVAWLRMESPTNPMMITGVVMLQSPISLAEVKQLIGERLLVYHRFQQRVVWQNDRPYWADDPYFHLDNQIHEHFLEPPGTQHQLEALVSDLMSTHLDFSKAPWDIHIVRGYGDGAALVIRLHHCIADGIALVRVLLSITDEYFDATNVHNPTPRTSRGPSFFRPAAKVVRATAKVTGTIVSEGVEMLVNPPHLFKRLKQGMSLGASLSRLALLPPDAPTVFKGAIGTRKRAAWSQPLPLDQLKAIGRATDAKINDVLAAAVAGALRRYLLARDQPVDDVTINVVVPVNLRPLDGPHTLGNYFGLVFLGLPVGLAEPQARLQAIKDRMDRIKFSSEAIALFGILQTAGAAPKDVQDYLVSLLSAKATGVLTNVPGPREPLHFQGHRLTNLMFWVPQAGTVGLGISILSYNGTVLVGFGTDERIVQDPHDLVRHFHDEITQLVALR